MSLGYVKYFLFHKEILVNDIRYYGFKERRKSLFGQKLDYYSLQASFIFTDKTSNIYFILSYHLI